MSTTDSASTVDWITSSKELSVSPYISNIVATIHEIGGAYIELGIERNIMPPDTDNMMIASESVLMRDWNTPEEDAAWANL